MQATGTKVRGKRKVELESLKWTNGDEKRISGNITTEEEKRSAKQWLGALVAVNEKSNQDSNHLKDVFFVMVKHECRRPHGMLETKS